MYNVIECFGICTQWEMVITITLIDTSIISHCFMFCFVLLFAMLKTLKICSLSKFQTYQRTVLLTTVIMLFTSQCSLYLLFRIPGTELCFSLF